MSQTPNRLRTVAGICIATAAVVSASGVQAADWCAGMITDTDPRVVRQLNKPSALQSYIDPAFGTRVTRITDAPQGTARRTLYTTIQPWNADESLLMLYHTGDANAGHHLYDGKTYQYIRPMEFSAGDIEGIYWDPNDANTLFFIQRRPKNEPMVGNLVRYNVKDRSRTQVADLSRVCGSPSSRGGTLATGGSDIQGMGGDLIGLRCQNNSVNGDSSDITFTVNVRNGRISNRVVLDPKKPQGSNSVGFSPILAAAPLSSGDRVLVQNSVYDRSMNYLYPLDSSYSSYRALDGQTHQVPKAEHSTTGRMPNGNDAFFTPQFGRTEFGCESDSDFGRGALVAHDIQGEQCSVIVGRSTGWGYPLSGVHLSAVSRQSPGWVTMTTMGYGKFDYFSNGQEAPLTFSELTLSLADPDDPTTCRLAHTRTFGKSAGRASSYRSAYFGEPHAVMSPSGSRILFNSDWYDSGSVDTYAVTLRSSPVASTPTPTSATTPATTPAVVSSPPPPRSVAVQNEPDSAPNVDTVIGYVFERDDSSELRWVDRNSEGLMGSTWISEACAASLGGATSKGDWWQLLSVAPATDTIESPCQSIADVPQGGYVYSRTDKDELRWITTNADGQQGSTWISESCSASLGGVSESGDWSDLMRRAPAIDSIPNPCL